MNEPGYFMVALLLVGHSIQLLSSLDKANHPALSCRSKPPKIRDSSNKLSIISDFPQDDGGCAWNFSAKRGNVSRLQKTAPSAQTAC